MKTYLPGVFITVVCCSQICAQHSAITSQVSLRTQLKDLGTKIPTNSNELNGFWESQEDGSYLAIDGGTRMAVLTPSPLLFEMRVLGDGSVEQLIAYQNEEKWSPFGRLESGLLIENLGDSGMIYRKIDPSILSLVELFNPVLNSRAIIDAGIALNNLPSTRSESLIGVWYNKFSGTIISVDEKGKAWRMSISYVYKLRKESDGSLMVALWRNEGEDEWKKFGYFREGTVAQISGDKQFKYKKK